MLKRLLVAFLAITTSMSAFAASSKSAEAIDEGMWLLMFIDRLNYDDMKDKGLKLTPEEIYSVNNASLKDAIVSFGGFCTAEVISSKGLLLTNHHCGYDAIQGVSTVENDYLTNGFWAKSHDEEFPIEGLHVNFLVEMGDVSEQVLGATTDEMSPEERAEKVGEAIAAAKKGLTEKFGEGYEISIKPFFDNNAYYYFVYQKFNDIRLVGTPPESIGKYGGDTDNWMWPRHTGDFSMFRIYSDKDGKPAQFAKENVPYQPKHHLPISLNGVKKNDYAMVLGYPGSTDRYLSSFGVAQGIEVFNPTFVDLRDVRLKSWKRFMDADPKVRLQYASKYASTANYWKYFIGQTKGLKRLNVLEKKQAEEAEFMNWVNASEDRKKLYANALSLIEEGYNAQEEAVKANLYFSQGLWAIETVKFAYQATAALEKMDEKEAIASLEESGKGFYKDFDKENDKALALVMLNKVYKDLKGSKYEAQFLSSIKTDSTDFPAYIDSLYATSIFSSEASFNNFLANYDKEALNADPVVELKNNVLGWYLSVVRPAMAGPNAKIAEGNRLYTKGRLEMNGGMSGQNTYYPNANFTMRLTYGQVLDYFPGDAMFYSYYTTDKGILQKEDPTNPEFILRPEMKKALVEKNFGKYADQNGDLRVCFITNNDITGGNSGSPVINGNGELIGLAFDGNWEAMSGDIAFEPELQRCINVDIRYVLFIIDQVYGAKNIIEELTFAKEKAPKGKPFEALMPTKY
ncbi:S46 family peptidase [Sediminitomix flava]|uniref:Dipeptidyl-peptidase n=1 Tax=Sediminitomix flava TaxID=379075 RepID=A0A315Z7M8_SEDFL|nr:S46 family peptidase [Sediminitomix flava]PWJ40746.1 dipeptidyl-peptidase 7 [Sediminitomix flava]